MFTGIIQATCKLKSVKRSGESAVLLLDLGSKAQELSIGDSVAVDGACLTVAGVRGPDAQFDVGAETLKLTTLGGLKAGSQVNVELPLRPGDRFGGHFVSGHVDGKGRITQKRRLPGECRLSVAVGTELACQMIYKGSVAVDGISLTIAGLTRDSFDVSLIPHTLAATTMDHKERGDEVNVECDMIGKWIRKLLQDGEYREGTPSGSLNVDRLEEEGF